MFGKKPKPDKNPLWRSPPPANRLIIPTKERFPGRGFAEKGARWLSGEAASNVSLAKRREYAKKCFEEAIDKCNDAIIRAQGKRNEEEVRRLTEIAIWLRTWLHSI